MKYLTRLTRDQTGDGYIDVAIVILIIFLLLASLLAFFPVLSAQQSLNNTAKQIARTIEITGNAGAELDSFLEDMVSLKPDEVVVDTVWKDASKKTIQLKTPFTVSVTKTVPVTIFRPVFGNPVVFNIRITAVAAGISEVYYK